MFQKINDFFVFVAAIALFKDEILVLENIDVAVEILIRFLCVVPGWGEKNVQVLLIGHQVHICSYSCNFCHSIFVAWVY